MNITDANISFFESCMNPIPVKTIGIYEFYDMIVTGVYADTIARIRADPENANNLKKKLPCVTISGIFSHRDEKHIIQHSYRICIDIDGKDNPGITDWSEVRTTLGTWGSIEFAALSASGKGMFLVIPIRYPYRHHDHFRAIESIFLKYGIKIDPACKDVSRLRFMSSDPDAVFNRNIDFLRIAYPEPIQPRPKKKNNKDFNPGNLADDLDKAIDQVVSSGIDITQYYKSWYEIGSALVNTFGEGGRTRFHRLSKLYPKYKPSECDKQYDACLKNPKRYSKATIYYYIKQHLAGRW